MAHVTFHASLGSAFAVVALQALPTVPRISLIGWLHNGRTYSDLDLSQSAISFNKLLVVLKDCYYFDDLCTRTGRLPHPSLVLRLHLGGRLRRRGRPGRLAGWLAAGWRTARLHDCTSVQQRVPQQRSRAVSQRASAAELRCCAALYTMYSNST